MRTGATSGVDELTDIGGTGSLGLDEEGMDSEIAAPEFLAEWVLGRSDERN